MDYKYIEQLLERYWECETSPAEESILRMFFSQKSIPAHLARYKSLFVYEQQQAQIHLDESFDKRLLEAVGQDEPAAAETKKVKVREITWTNRLRPLFRSAAAVAIVTLLGTSVHHSFISSADTQNPSGWDYNPSAYKDSYQDPAKAYEFSMKALDMFKEGATTAEADTVKRQ